MAGIDEASARSVLAVMQERLARDPMAALGIPANATAEDVRSAFLQLTKQFHPVRFGRMAIDIQKLSNEVFLALRAAHDAVSKTIRRQTGPIPTPTSTNTSPAVRPPPPAAGPQPAGARSQPLRPRPGAPGDSGERPPAATTAAATTVAIPAVIPPGGNKTVPRSPAQPAGQTSQALPTAPPRPGAPIRPVTAQLVTQRDETVVLDLLSRQQWDQARTALHQLSARDPSSKRIRALVCYAKGREAQVEGRVDDARVELHDALDLDPDLQAAKTALTELFTRRK